MDDLNRIYNISIDSEETSFGKLFFILILVVSVIELVTFPLIKLEKFKKYFGFQSTLNWFLFTIGVLMFSALTFAKFGEITSFKCHLQIILLSLGLSFIYIPILTQLIIYFPDKNKYSEWVNKNKYLIFSLFTLVELFLNGLTFIVPIKVKDIYIDNGSNFQKCQFNVFTIATASLILIYKAIITLSLLLLIFIEWNDKTITYDIKFILCSIYINLITCIIYIVVNVINIKNYLSYYQLHLGLILIMTFSNYIVLFAIRLIMPFVKLKNEDLLLISKNKMSNSNNNGSRSITKTSVMSDSKLDENANNATSIYEKILEYHYRGTSEMSCSSSHTEKSNKGSTGISIDKSNV